MTVTEPRILAAETYRGRTIEVTESIYTTANGHSQTYRSLVLDGHSSRCPVGADDEVLKKARKVIDRQLEDEQLLAKATAVIDYWNTRAQIDAATTPADVKPGDIVYVYGLGYYRRGIVTKVTKSGKAEVAYTTASSGGRIYRKTDNITELRVRPDWTTNL